MTDTIRSRNKNSSDVGWLLSTKQKNDVILYSSEVKTIVDRPMLTISYKNFDDLNR